MPNAEKLSNFIELDHPAQPVGVNSVDPVLQKLAAILSPALAAMFGQQQTTHVPDSIKGTSLDQNSPAGQEAQQPIQPPQSNPNQVAAAFLPPGAQPSGQAGAPAAPQPAQGAPTPPQGAPTAAQGQPPTPLAPNTGINANPIARSGALGGSGIGGMANMQYMPKTASAREVLAKLGAEVGHSSVHTAHKQHEEPQLNWPERHPYLTTGGILATSLVVRGLLRGALKSHMSQPQPSPKFDWDQYQHPPHPPSGYYAGGDESKIASLNKGEKDTRTMKTAQSQWVMSIVDLLSLHQLDGSRPTSAKIVLEKLGAGPMGSLTGSISTPIGGFAAAHPPIGASLGGAMKPPVVPPMGSINALNSPPKPAVPPMGSINALNSPPKPAAPPAHGSPL